MGGVAAQRTSRAAKKSWDEKFLAELSHSGNVTLACKAAGIGRSKAYEEKAANPVFAAFWEAALDQAVEVLEAEAFRRAVKGTRKPVFQGGELVGHVTEYSDTLLIFLTKGAKPEKYRERYQVDETRRVSGQVDVNVNGNVDLRTLSPEELQRRYREALGAPAAVQPGPVSPEPGTGSVGE